jgi:hypothetical protein
VLLVKSHNRKALSMFWNEVGGDERGERLATVTAREKEERVSRPGELVRHAWVAVKEHKAQPSPEKCNVWQENSEEYCDRENELRTHVGN